MTAPNLADLRALDKAATPGPWRALSTGVRGGDHWHVVADSESVAWIAANDGSNEDEREPIAALIAAYRNATPALVAALTDVLALADQWRDRGHIPECTASYPPCERCAKAAGAAELRRVITNHVTPDAPASETTETKG